MTGLSYISVEHALDYIIKSDAHENFDSGIYPNALYFYSISAYTESWGKVSNSTSSQIVAETKAGIHICPVRELTSGHCTGEKWVSGPKRNDCRSTGLKKVFILLLVPSRARCRGEPRSGGRHLHLRHHVLGAPHPGSYWSRFCRALTAAVQTEKSIRTSN